MLQRDSNGKITYLTGTLMQITSRLMQDPEAKELMDAVAKRLIEHRQVGGS
jgi:hypothetical protein